MKRLLFCLAVLFLPSCKDIKNYNHKVTICHHFVEKLRNETGENLSGELINFERHDRFGKSGKLIGAYSITVEDMSNLFHCHYYNFQTEEGYTIAYNFYVNHINESCDTSDICIFDEGLYKAAFFLINKPEYRGPLIWTPKEIISPKIIPITQ